jgi:hypothetical protein
MVSSKFESWLITRNTVAGRKMVMVNADKELGNQHIMASGPTMQGGCC